MPRLVSVKLRLEVKLPVQGACSATSSNLVFYRGKEFSRVNSATLKCGNSSNRQASALNEELVDQVHTSPNVIALNRKRRSGDRQDCHAVVVSCGVVLAWT